MAGNKQADAMAKMEAEKETGGEMDRQRQKDVRKRIGW